MGSQAHDAPLLHIFKPQELEIPISQSPARHSQIINPSVSPARSITDAIRDGSHKALFAAAATEQQMPEVEQSSGLDFGLPPRNPARHDPEHEKTKPRDVGIDGPGPQTGDFFDMDSSDAEEVEKGDPKTEGEQSTTAVISDDHTARPAQSSFEDQFLTGTTATESAGFKPDEEGFAEFLKFGTTEHMNADSGIGMDNGPDTIFSPHAQTYAGDFPPFHANGSSLQLSISDLRPTSDGSLFREHPELVYNTEDLKKQFAAFRSQNRGASQRLALYTEMMRTEQNIAKHEARHSKKSKRPRSATGRSAPREFGPSYASTSDDRRASSAVPARRGILRNPSFGPSPVSSNHNQSKRRSMSSPTPPLPEAITPPVPPPPTSDPGTDRKRSTMLSHIKTNGGADGVSLITGPGPLHTSFPFEQEEDSSADKDPIDPSSSAQPPKSIRSASGPAVRIVMPPNNLRQSLGNADARRKSRAISVSVSSDTILALSARRRYASDGHAITRLVVPADTELAFPAISRRTSQAQGRRMSTATTNPDSIEKPTGPSNKKASDFDDGALFRTVRKAYYNELLGSNIAARFWRRYLSARTLRRITLCNPGLYADNANANANALSRAEAGKRPFLARHTLLNDAQSEAKLLSHFRAPNQGRARYAWVAWIHRIAIDVDEDNEDFAARLQAGNVDGEVSRISAVPGGLEFVEGWSVWRCLLAALLVVTCSVAVCVVYIADGPLPAQGAVAVAVTRGQQVQVGEGWLSGRDAEGRVVAGACLGVLMFWVGGAVAGAWAWASWLEM